MPRKRINYVWNKWFVMIYIVHVCTHIPPQGSGYQCHMDLHLLQNGKEAKNNLSTGLWWLCFLSSQGKLQRDTQKVNVFLCFKNLDWLFLQPKSQRKTLIRCMTSNTHIVSIHVLNTPILLYHTIFKDTEKKTKLEPFALIFTVWFLSIIIFLFSLSCQLVNISTVSLNSGTF